jgi:hypothetical protein
LFSWSLPLDLLVLFYLLGPGLSLPLSIESCSYSCRVRIGDCRGKKFMLPIAGIFYSQDYCFFY